jgi:CDP-diacylglycerol--serine O-phosphatidyltransferase
MPSSRRHLSMIRSYTWADVLTIGNAACGTICLLLCVDYMAFGDVRRLWIAMGLLPLALVFDALDGYVARLDRTRQSMLGADLDSLADVISFVSGSAMISTVRIPKP